MPSLPKYGELVSLIKNRLQGAPYQVRGDDIETGIDCFGAARWLLTEHGLYVPTMRVHTRRWFVDVTGQLLQPLDVCALTINLKTHLVVYVGMSKVMNWNVDGLSFLNHNTLTFRRVFRHRDIA